MEKPEERERDPAPRAEILIVDTDSNAELLIELKEIRHALKASHHRSLGLGFLAIIIAIIGVMNTLKPSSWDRWFFLAMLLFIAFMSVYDWYFEPDPILRKEKKV